MARQYREGNRIVQGHDRNKCSECMGNLVGDFCPRCDLQGGADGDVGNALKDSRVRCR